MVRLAAVGDIHVREGEVAQHREFFSQVCREVDVLVLAGDLTNRGLTPEAETLVESLGACRIPVVGVLGNHDYECGNQDEVLRILCQGGVHMLGDEPCEVEGVGFAGVKGFCGGFDRHALAPWGEQTIKDFVRVTLDDALILESGLAQLRTPHKVAVLHYAPIRETVVGEPAEIFPFLGSSRLAEPIDRFHVSVVFHGHAHNGTYGGKTMSGIPVYNVAMPIMRRLNPERPFHFQEL